MGTGVIGWTPAACGVAPVAVGECRSEGGQSEARFRDLLDFGLSSYMAPIVARLSLDDMCPRGTRVAFDLDAWLPGATEATPDDGGASTRPRQTSPNSIGGAA